MMRFFKLLMPCAVLLLFVSSVLAQQERRTDNLADRLAQQAAQLAESSYNYYTNTARNSRADTEALFQDQQLGSSAEMFRRMVRDRRPRAELQDATVVLSDMARRADRYNRQRGTVTAIQQTISDIQRDLNFGGGGGFPGGGGGFPGGGGGNQSGTMHWNGTVDDTTQVRVQQSYVDVSAISGTPYTNGTFNFTSPLPMRRTTVRLNKIRGRGDVRIIQQPTRDNDFTAVVEIRDPNRGPDDYEFELSW